MTPYRDQDVAVFTALLDAKAQAEDAMDSLEEAREAYLHATRVLKDAKSSNAGLLPGIGRVVIEVGVVVILIIVAVGVFVVPWVIVPMSTSRCEDSFSSDMRHVECRGGARMQVTPTGILCTCPREGGAP